MGDELKTWTFYGYWENDRLVIEYTAEGEVDDDREDDGEHEQGLWAASASGRTIEEAEREVRAEYEECEGHPAGPYDPMGETAYCDGSCR